MKTKFAGIETRKRCLPALVSDYSFQLDIASGIAVLIATEAVVAMRETGRSITVRFASFVRFAAVRSLQRMRHWDHSLSHNDKADPPTVIERDFELPDSPWEARYPSHM